MSASIIVDILLGEDDLISEILGEASIHRPRRGSKWVASYTGPDGEQVWKTTGTPDRVEAIAIAKEFEAAARAQRAKSDPHRKNALIQRGGAAAGGLTQAEVAHLLSLNVRTVRAVERRALRKLSRHPQLRDLWRQYTTGELTEDHSPLSAAEIIAVLELARSRAERQGLWKAIWALSK